MLIGKIAGFTLSDFELGFGANITKNSIVNLWADTTNNDDKDFWIACFGIIRAKFLYANMRYVYGDENGVIDNFNMFLPLSFHLNDLYYLYKTYIAQTDPSVLESAKKNPITVRETSSTPASPIVDNFELVEYRDSQSRSTDITTDYNYVLKLRGLGRTKFIKKVEDIASQLFTVIDISTFVYSSQ